MKRLQVLSEIWRPFTDNRAALYAAGASFYILLSVFPAWLFLLALLPQLPGVMEAAMDFLHSIIPAGLIPLVSQIYDALVSDSSVTLLSLSAVTVLWSASKGMLAMMDGLNAVLGQPDKRCFLWRRLLAILYFLLLALGLSVMLLLHVLGQHVLTALLRYLPGLSALWELLLQFRLIYTLPPLTLLFTLLYRVLPASKLSLRCCLMGGLAASALWLAVSSLFSVYVNFAAGRRMLYGSLGFLILAMLWLHLCILILLYSGIFSALMDRGDYHPIQILKYALSRRNS